VSGVLDKPSKIGRGLGMQAQLAGLSFPFFSYVQTIRLLIQQQLFGVMWDVALCAVRALM